MEFMFYNTPMDLLMNFEYLFWIFQLSLPVENNTKYS